MIKKDLTVNVTKQIKKRKIAPILSTKNEKFPILPKSIVDNLVIVDVVPNVVEKRKRGRPGTKKMYFTGSTEDAIIRYNSTDSIELKNKIYNEEIKYPFEKLAENIFNTFKFTYFEVSPLDTQKEVVSFLVGNLHKFEQNKGKAFSYFSIVAKHYLILQNNTNYKRFKQHVDVNEQPMDRKELISPAPGTRKQELKEFIKLMIQYWDKNLNTFFKKGKDLEIANAVLQLFRNCDRMETFNKKALYLYVREMTDCKTQHITKIVNKMKSVQESIFKEYMNSGTITD